MNKQTKALAKRRGVRRGGGQALIEGACALYLIVLLTVGTVALVFTVGALAYYKIKLSIIAATAARQAVNSTYWLGAKRPDFDPVKTQTEAMAMVRNQAKALGLPPLNEKDIKITQDLTDSKMCTVQVAMNYVPMLGGGFLPSVLPLVETGVEPYLVDSPTGVMGLALDTGNGQGRGFFIPCYGRGVNFSNGVLSDPKPEFQAYPEGKFPYWQTTSIPAGKITQNAPGMAPKII